MLSGMTTPTNNDPPVPTTPARTNSAPQSVRDGNVPQHDFEGPDARDARTATLVRKDVVVEPYPTNFNEAIVRLKGEFVDIIKTFATDILEGAAADVQAYGVAIATDLSRVVEVPAERRQLFIDECLGQMKAVAELNRIRFNAATFKVFQKTLVILAGVFSSAANAAAMNIPGLVNSVVGPLLTLRA